MLDRRRFQASQDYRDLVLSMAPVSYWRLGERSGTVARDEMGRNHGTYVAAPALGVLGALAGDGDTAMALTRAPSGGAYMVTPALPALTEWTVALWFKPLDASADYDNIFSSGGDLFDVVIHFDHLIAFYDGTWRPTYVPVALNESVFLVFSYTVAGGLVFSKNDASAYAEASGGRSITSQQWYWGAFTNGGNVPGARFDEPAIWNRAITAAEIRALYDAGMGR